jgi:hypothetical protein
MKRLSITCALFLFLFLGRVQAQSQTQPQAGQPKLVMGQDTYDAGEIYKSDDGLKHDFAVRNEGTAELKIISATPG